ncbi:MAG: T9SS type A sorting domain-containing protein [Bacteroidia bacterium]|nr:T9SS type A sorting domain-containing protein [Bacteroidia bacterium]
MKNALLRFCLFLLLSSGAGLQALWAQCPGDMTIYTDSGQCTAVVNFVPPVFAGGLDTAVFNYSGAPQMWVVPAGVDTVEIRTWGAQGNFNFGGIAGGLGGYSVGWLPVVPGDTLFVYVGGGGATGPTGGYNGGGNGGNATGCADAYGAGGGGGTDVRVSPASLGDRVIVAGGGGGAGGQRIMGCGRGRGAGGGGGWYGGGGGAGYPQNSTTVPTGGTQVAGGTAGTSTYSAANINGTAGGFGYGGTGGDEVQSNQAGNTSATPGANGGGATGGSGSYVNSSYTGHSGGGGSGYIGGVLNGSMQSGIRTGDGLAWIIFNSTIQTTQLSGVTPGDTSGVDTLVQSYEVDYGSYQDTCTFMIYVQDNQIPTAVCASETLNVGASGSAMVSTAIDGGSYDNCGITSMTAWANTFTCADVDSTREAWLAVWDNSGNSDTCMAMVYVVDQTAPNANCKDITVTLGSGGTVTILPGQVDNGSADICGSVNLAVSPDFFNGQDLGANSVTLTVTDGSGNSSSCTATVTVVDSNLTGIDGNGLNGISFAAFPNPTKGNFNVKVSCAECAKGETLELKVVSIHGALIERRKVDLMNGEINLELNLSDQAAGQYLLSLTGKSGSIFRHIIKM